MHQIDLKKAEKWSRRSQYEPLGPLHIDLNCPHEGCGKPTFSTKLDWQFINSAGLAEITCAGCDKKINYYMTHPPTGKSSPEESNTVIYRHI
jgi:hypothetical protein